MKNTKEEIKVIESLIKRIVIDSERGKIIWLKPKSKIVKSGDLSGGLENNGYRIINYTFQNKKYRIKAHRLIFYKEYGYLPRIIDHINGNKDDNRIENLRECTFSENCYNSKISRCNKSGIKGVRFRPEYKSWVAQITVNGEQIHLGSFKSKEAAIKARKEAEENYFNQSFNPEKCRI